MLGVRDTEWDRKVSVANCVMVFWFRKNSKFYSYIIPTIVMLVTYATYTVIMKQELTGACSIAIEKDHFSKTGMYVSFQDLLQYISVFFVEDAVTTLVISN
jgi:hypothetical protein